MQPRRSSLANGLENALDQLKLVGCEGIVFDEVCPITIGPEGHATVREGELILEDVAFRLEDLLQGLDYLRALG